jgi:hypothetical protein
MCTPNRVLPQQLPDGKKREIDELWFAASYYFSQACKRQKKSPKKWLKKTPKNISVPYRKPSAYTKQEKNLRIMTADLTSCAIRLFTIEERLEESCGGNNRVFPNKYLDNCKKLTTVADIETELKQKLDKYLHQILRDNTVHIEQSTSKNNKINIYQARQNIIVDISYQKIYNLITKSFKTFEAKLRGYGLIS